MVNPLNCINVNKLRVQSHVLCLELCLSLRKWVLMSLPSYSSTTEPLSTKLFDITVKQSTLWSKITPPSIQILKLLHLSLWHMLNAHPYESLLKLLLEESVLLNIVWSLKKVTHSWVKHQWNSHQCQSIRKMVVQPRNFSSQQRKVAHIRLSLKPRTTSLDKRNHRKSPKNRDNLRLCHHHTLYSRTVLGSGLEISWPMIA